MDQWKHVCLRKGEKINIHSQRLPLLLEDTGVFLWFRECSHLLLTLHLLLHHKHLSHLFQLAHHPPLPQPRIRLLKHIKDLNNPILNQQRMQLHLCNDPPLDDLLQPQPNSPKSILQDKHIFPISHPRNHRTHHNTHLSHRHCQHIGWGRIL